MSSVVWIIAIVILLIFVFLKDKKIKASSEYKKAIQSKQKPPRKLYIKRWWTWIIVIILVIAWWFNFSENVYYSDIANNENTSVKNKKLNHKSIKHEKLNTNKKEKKTKENKYKKHQLKDSQKTMSDDLYNNQELKKYILKIKYTGNGNADINVASNFADADQRSKTKIAKKVNTLVTSDAEDVGANADPYSFLTFIYQGKLIGNSKQFSHNEYKWQNN